MKLTLVLTLLAVTSTFAWHLGKRDFIRRLQDENSVSESSAPLPNIDFTGNWEENVHGELGVGREFQIKYNGSRLPWRPTMYGQAAWDIFVEYKFDDYSPFVSEELGDQPSDNIFKKVIRIPINATKVLMWFKHWGYYTSYRYDSNYGKNYYFPITRPSIVFERKAWDEREHGDLVAGGHFDLFYDSRRLKEGAQVQAQMKFVDDDVLTKALDRTDGSSYQTSVISIPEDAEKVEMWFYYEDDDGNKHYDSDYGQNYHFPLSETE
ncbi:uncharacterized protein LOC114530974 [Dendronephthya gigantea]|uniref:uncharacterized protein LOC114530974 n=1 Tax=Dendronephthya gigantea TaxID=151771 RepID=UPI00106B2376|nr:uncharacterized protein LOC114530974 [Dendronephthya gigantea]